MPGSFCNGCNRDLQSCQFAVWVVGVTTIAVTVRRPTAAIHVVCKVFANENDCRFENYNAGFGLRLSKAGWGGLVFLSPQA